jgi:hypothetical protein
MAFGQQPCLAADIKDDGHHDDIDYHHHGNHYVGLDDNITKINNTMRPIMPFRMLYIYSPKPQRP